MKLARSLYHYLVSFLGNLLFFCPSKKIKVIGITGTKGKSTTIALLSEIFEKAGIKTASLSSVYVKIGEKLEKNKTGNTMPGRFFIQSFLSRAVKAGCRVAFIEVTSQGIIQHRHRFIKWDKAVFLDIHPEHIESHGSFDNYLKAKVSFFSYARKHGKKNVEFFVNGDDKFSKDFIEAAQNFFVKVFSASNIYGIYPPTTLLGYFNKINIAAAAAVSLSENIAVDKIKKTVENFSGILGRMNIIKKEPFLIIVDYAHTPDSLEEVYKFASKEKRENMICLIGSAGGGRDKWKRPKMGEIASKYCDTIILTDEDPYDEDPDKIIGEIEMGFIEEEKFNVFKILDRKEAIKKAVSLAKKGDVIVSTGKGSEDYIHVSKGKKIPWSETKEFESNLTNL